MKKKSICFATLNCRPDYLGGYALYHKNLIKTLDKNKLEIFWVYFGKENKKFKKENVNYIEIKTNKLMSFLQLGIQIQLFSFFKNNYFDVINTVGGPWNFMYKKKKEQKIIQTFHGTVYYFNKNHFKRFNLFKKILFSPLLPLSWIQERPHKKTDKIICVSNKVKKQVQNLYGSNFPIKVIRTGVDLKEFKPRERNPLYERLNLDSKLDYGLYVGGGGYWTKGLDRAINLGKEINKLNKNFRLIVIGPDYKKVKHLLKGDFMIFLQNIPREKMPLYYSVSDIFFCMSRYEGGAPILVVSEAMASGCLLVSSKDSEQEIIKDKRNGLIIEEFGKKDAKRILSTLKNKKEIIKNSRRRIKELFLEKWGRETVEELVR